jgi:crotonobetainyl-CoA:carnitine CoA-transferase CaiB-like acyl-CoA transferase
VNRWAPLAGITVVDLSQQLPGPFATLLLRTLGARVIKVEPPQGDAAREIDPPMFARVNAGKEILSLNLKSADDQSRLHALVADADVFFEGFRPGVAARLDADWEKLSKLNPRLVYCSLSGFGAEGPMAQRPGHDLNFLALAAGVVEGLSAGEALIRVPWVDLAAGTNAALLIVSALIDRASTGQGRHIEVAMLDAAAVWSAAKLPRPGGEGAYGVFETVDRRRVAVSVLEDAMWRRLCQALGWDDWLADPDMAGHEARRARADEVRQRLSADVAAHEFQDLLTLAVEHDCAISPVNEIDDVARDPQIAARGIFTSGEHWFPLGPAAGSLPIDHQLPLRPPGPAARLDEPSVGV